MIEAVVIAKDGRLGVCIDICLEMSSEIPTSRDAQGKQAARSPEIKPQRPQSGEEIGMNNPQMTSDLLGIDDGENGVKNLSLDDNVESGDRPGGYVDLMD